ncbi:M23 family metallopeptidase, partial [Desulfallas sp. Bu1-1]|uniref:M23 family metallopeptidase n=1 Tax=Desulfallas sp. Bu1-1 TaxID=2787620 RepID=UPI00189F1D7C
YKVTPGDEVEKGQVIAKADSTGWSTGDHLHFEVRAGKNKTQFIDPLTVLK